MNASLALAALLQNAALLLALVLLFELFGAHLQERRDLRAKLLAGSLVGLIALAVMAFPAELEPGVRFDMRSVLYGLCGLFLGPLPTLIAMAMGAVYRLFSGGLSPWLGVAGILLSGGLGLCCRALLGRSLADYRWWEFYLFGLCLHLVMMGFLALARDIGLGGLFNPLALCFLLVYPLATLLIGLLMQHFVRRQREVSDSRIFRTLIDQSYDAIEVIDWDTGCFLDVNEAACRQMGYSRQEFLNLHISDLDHGLDHEGFLHYRQALRREEYLLLEREHSRKDQSRFPVEVNLRYVALDRQYIIAVVRDISERKQAQRRRVEESVRRRILVEQSRDGIVVLDDSGAVHEANHQFAAMLRCSREELQHMHIWDWNPWLPRERLIQVLRDVDERGAHFETRHMRMDGTSFDVEISTNGAVVAGKKLIFCVCRDITARKRDEEALKLAALVYQNSHEAMMITGADTVIVDVNPTFTRITGYERDEAIGQRPNLLRSDRQDPAFYKRMWRELTNTGHWEGEIWNRRKNGEVFPQWLSINAVKDSEGEVTRWVAQFTDISEKKHAERVIWHQANFDALTNLPNRYMFQDRLEHELKQAKRHGHKLALMFLDLDHFKEVNDSLGHDMGDRLLQQAAGRLRECVRESDTIARLGGDEFVIIISDFTDNSMLATVAQKVLDSLARPYQMGRESAWITTSIGITLFPDDGDRPEDLLKQADQAMYAAKKQGRNRYQYFTPEMQRSVLERMQTGNDLRQALERQQLTLAYQPIVRLHDGEVTRAEALLRWRHPQSGAVPPSQFIPVAEDIGLIHELGDWVFQRVIQQLTRCLALRPDFQLCINTSPLQFRGANQAHWLDWLDAAGLPGSSLVVEITENMLFDTQPWVKERLRALSDRGIQVAVDDFGTGYSSLAYLRKLEIDFLKIDRSYIANLNGCGEDRVIVEAMIHMAQGLGIAVIAEGVESAEQATILRELGCDFAQGFHFHRPADAAALEALLEQSAQLVEH